MITPTSGHSAFEAENTDALVRATDTVRLRRADGQPRQRRPVRIALEHPQPGPQLQVELVAFALLLHQPCRRLRARHRVHGDVLAVDAAAFARAHRPSARTNAMRSLLMPDDVGPTSSTSTLRGVPAGFLDQFAARGGIRACRRRDRRRPGRPASRSCVAPSGTRYCSTNSTSSSGVAAMMITAMPLPWVRSHVFPVAAAAPGAATGLRRGFRGCLVVSSASFGPCPDATPATVTSRLRRPRLSCRRRRVIGPKRRASHSADQRARHRRWPRCEVPSCDSGASSAIVVSWRHSSACSRCARSFAATLRRAAQAQERHFVDAREQRIEACRNARAGPPRSWRRCRARRGCCRPRRR